MNRRHLSAREAPDAELLWALRIARSLALEASKSASGRITIDQLRILFEIAYRDLADQPVGVNYLSDYLDLPRSSVSRMVANLLDEGRIVESVASDARQHPLRLSEPSRKRFRETARLLAQGPFAVSGASIDGT